MACAFEIPRLAEAALARGLRLVPFREAAPPVGVAALLLGCGGDRDPEACVGPLRARGWRGPVILLLAGGCVARALDAGADDAVALPAAAEEIAARLAARLRGGVSHRIEVGALRVDPVDRRAVRDGRPLALLPREYALLLHLARRAGQCVSREELLSQVWRLGFDPGTNVVEVHISRLRAKLDRGFDWPMLETEKGRGYRLCEAPDQGSSAISDT